MEKLTVRSPEDLLNITEEITELYFTSTFNEPLFNIPYWIKKINFNSSSFNFSLDFLPEGLEKLFLSYQKPKLEELKNLPIGLKVLHLGKCFNQELKPNTLPEKLEVLYFGNYYNRDIKPNVLPKSL
jgi:hypothetical protein